MSIKIIDTLSVIDRTEAQALAMDVNDAFFQANEHATQAIGYYIKAGEALSQARHLFQGDKEYGQWRAENTSVSKGWAGKLVKVFDTYGNKPPKELPISALGELAGAPEAVRKSVEARAKDPDQKTPSVRDIKKEVKEAKTGQARVDEQIAKRDEPKEPTISVEEQAQKAIDLPIHERISIWNGISQEDRTEVDAFILLGLPAYFDGTPNIDTIILIIGAMREEYQTIEFDEAYDIIKEWMK